MPDNDRIVYEIPKSREGEVIRATLGNFKGRQFASSRIYYRNNEGEWLPTKKGITIAADDFQQLEDAVAALRAAIDGASSQSAPPSQTRRRRSA